MIILCVMLLFDFGLTWYAVANGLAYEANIILEWMFEYSFIPSLLIRLGMMALLLIPFWLWIRNRKSKDFVMRIAYGIEALVLMTHLYWIVPAINIRL